MRKVLNVLTAPVTPLIMWFPLSVAVYLVTRCNVIVAVILALAVIGTFTVADSVEVVLTRVIQFVKFKRQLAKYVSSKNKENEV